MRSTYPIINLVIFTACVVTTTHSKLTVLDSEQFDGRLTNMLYHQGLLYIGGEDTIRILNADLKLNFSKSTCSSPPCGNFNKVLLLNKDENEIITCGTGENGTFKIRSLSDLAIITNSSSVVPRNEQYLRISSDHRTPVQALLTMTKELIIAITYGEGIDKRNQNDKNTYFYAISTRNMQDFSRGGELGGYKSLAVDIQTTLDEYLIYYKGSFQSDWYSYFVTNQKNFVGGDQFVSKLVRICQNDTGYNSYTDIQLQCVQGSTVYNLIQNVVLLTVPNNDKIVIGTFTKGSSAEKEPEQASESVICTANLKELDKEVMNAKKKYTTSCIVKEKSEKDEVESERYLKSLKGGNCINESDYSHKDFLCGALPGYTNVIGNTTANMKHSFTISQDHGYVTTIYGTVLDDDYHVVMAGTSKGLLTMMNLRNEKLELFQTISVGTEPIQALHQEDDDTLYVMTTSKIAKYGSINCSEFTTCGSVMKAKNPLCGWCIFKNRATRNDTGECPHREWLHSFNACVSIVTNLKGFTIGQEGKVEITAHYLPFRQNDKYNCSFTNDKTGTTIGQTEKAERDSSRFSCSIPSVQEHTEATLSLLIDVDGGSVQVASTPFLFYNCDHYKRCGECVNTSGANCSWDLDKPECTAYQDTDSAISNVDMCPKLGNNNGLNFIPGNVSSQTISLNVSNFQKMSNSTTFWCYIPKRNGHLNENVAATREGNSLKCNLTIATEDKKAKKDVRIYIKYSSSSLEASKLLDDEYNNTVTVYDCSELAGDCSRCKSLNESRFKCGWCLGNRECKYGTGCNKACPAPTVTKIVPRDGPLKGNTLVTVYGTELGTKKADISNVKIGVNNCDINGVNMTYCLIKDEDFKNDVPKCILCKTKPGTKEETVSVKIDGGQSQGNVSFAYKKPTVTYIQPTHGPKSGGTEITIYGENLGIGNRIWTVYLQSQFCLNPHVQPNVSLAGEISVNFTIKCETPGYRKPKVPFNLSSITLYMDESSSYTGDLEPPFTILMDPNISRVSTSNQNNGFLSGGTVLTVTGRRLNNANKGVVKYIYKGEEKKEECDIKSEEKMLCKVPRATSNIIADLMNKINKSNRRKRSTCKECIEVNIVVKLDGVTKDIKLRYFRDPSIDKFGNKGDVLLYGTDDRQLILSGKDLNLVATKDDFTVTIGVEECAVIELTADTLRCSPPISQPTPINSKHTFPEVHVNVGNIHVSVGYLEYEKKVELIAIIAGAASGGLLFIIVIILVIVFIKYRKVGKKAREYEKNLSDMEMEIKRVAREEFLDMHTTMSTVNKNLVEQGFPYHSYQQFACNVMFSVDYLWTEPVVSNGKMTDDERLKANKGMEKLESLIYNKFFLVSVISTMEKEKRFFIREKSNLAGNLCAVLMGKMDYLDEILKLLMTNLVQDSSVKKHKTLFRRCESITEKLLSNWVSLCLYPHIKRHSGSPLYLLYMASQKTMESGPIDAVTCDAKYTLSEEKLLKNWSSSEVGAEDLKFEAKTLTLNLVVDNGEEIFKCKVLDCDTILQVKNKCLSQIYVNFPASQLPVGANDLALEWHEGFGGILKLRDIDNTSKREGHWLRLNTLAHYNVKDDSNMALIDPKSADILQQEDYVNLAQINMDGTCDGSMDSSEPLAPLTLHDEESEHEVQHWHLVKKEEESSKQGKSAIAELYLNRLFTTKQSVMEYMRPLFDIILDQDRCPPPTKFLFDFLDELGDRYKVDGDTVHAWKSHSYAIRVWASLMKMPNLLFDVVIPQYMDDNLSIISQVFIESFSLASQKFTKDSPSQKLIFHHEMNHYREIVKGFYKNVKVDEQNAEEFRQYMAEVNRLQQQTNFSKVSALYRLYKQLKPYFEDILENLSTNKEASDLGLDRKLEQVIAIMEEEED